VTDVIVSTGGEGAVVTTVDSTGAGVEAVVSGAAVGGEVCVQQAMRIVPARNRERSSRDLFIEEHVPVTGG